MFRRIAIAALIAGLLGGVAVTLAQGLTVWPLIFEAETYEAATATEADHGTAWSPEGLERAAWTTAANVVTGVGFALLLSAGFALSGRPIDWRRGLVWGAAGFTAFAALPALGLPAELPGTEAAPLIARQAWWFATVAASAGGLALIAFGPGVAWKGAGVVLLVVPHLVGAPEPARHGGLAPEALANAFVAASLGSNALFWLVLGGAAGFAFDWLGRR